MGCLKTDESWVSPTSCSLPAFTHRPAVLVYCFTSGSPWEPSRNPDHRTCCLVLTQAILGHAYSLIFCQSSSYDFNVLLLLSGISGQEQKFLALGWATIFCELWLCKLLKDSTYSMKKVDNQNSSLSHLPVFCRRNNSRQQGSGEQKNHIKVFLL